MENTASELIPTKIKPTNKPAKQIKDRLADWYQEIKLKNEPRHDKASPAAVKVHTVRLSFYDKGKQATDSLIAKITHLSIHAVGHASKALCLAGYWNRTRIETRDDLGHIRTHYNYEPTEQGRAWKHKIIPFYLHNPQKTIDLMDQYSKDKGRFVKEYFWERKQAKKLKELNNKVKNPNDTIPANSIIINNKSNSNELALLLNSETVKGMVAVFSESLSRNKKIDNPEHPDLKLTRWQENKLIDGAIKSMNWFTDALENDRLKKSDYSGHLCLIVAEQVVDCLENQWPSSKISSGHFNSPDLFNNWLPIYLHDVLGTYCQEIESIDQLPGIKLYAAQEEKIQKQRRREVGEEEEEERPSKGEMEHSRDWAEEMVIDYQKKKDDEASSHLLDE